jgi:cytochrome b
MTEQETKVWDIFVRIFHWSLVATFAIAYLTEEELLSLHVFAGYAVFGLIMLRLVWGFIGTRHARFSDFVYRPAEVKAFLRDTLYLRAKRYIGHNPAGGMMVILMMIGLLLTGVSGFAIYAAEESAGPLAMLAQSLHPYEGALEEVHEFFANFMVLLIVMHVGGVLVESFIHQENLVKAMWNGRKRAATEERRAGDEFKSDYI